MNAIEIRIRLENTNGMIDSLLCSGAPASSYQAQLSRFCATGIQLSLPIRDKLACQPPGTHPVWHVFRRRELRGPLTVIAMPEHDLSRVGVDHRDLVPGLA